MLNLMLLTHDPVIAAAAQEAGVNRIFYDLEYINKRERQYGRNTYIADYDIKGIGEVKKVLYKSKLVVRINPINYNSENEISEVLKYKPDYIMLPMVTDIQDVEKVIKYVNHNSKIIIMVETPQALARLTEILEIKGIDEIFVGLNDLHIGLGLDFMFEILSFGLMDYIADKCLNKNIPFGFGGIAKIGNGDLPSEYIIGEHYRLKSSSVILSRVFKGTRDSGEKAFFDFDITKEIEKIREKEKECQCWNKEQFDTNKKIVEECTKRIVEKI